MPPADAGRRFPDVRGLHTLQADLHQHTVFSDGVVWPHVRVAEARADELDVIAITDHLEWQPHQADLPNPDRNRGYEIARAASQLPDGLSEGDLWILERRAAGDEAAIAAQHILSAKPDSGPPPAPRRPVLVLPGAEITRGHSQPGRPALGHVSALLVADVNRLLLSDPLEVLQEVRRQDGFAFWNHPWSSPPPGDGVCRLGPWHDGLIRQGLISGIEIANDRSFSEEAFRMALEHDLTMIGSSDIHGLIGAEHPLDRGRLRPITLVFAEDRTEAAVKHALRSRHTAVCFRQTLIGRPEWIEPLLQACLSAGTGHYQPEPGAFSVQERPTTSVLRVQIRNASGLALLLRGTGPYSIMGDPGPIPVPAHSYVDVAALTGTRLQHADLRFEVLNGLIAPRRHPEVVLPVSIADQEVS
jgi:hypothetical protein